MLILIYLCLLGSLALIGMSLFKTEERVRLSPALKNGAGPDNKKPRSLKGALGSALALTRRFLSFNTLLSDALGRQKIEGQLSLAEINLSPEDLLAVKEIIIAGLIFALFSLTKEINLGWLLLAVAAGFYLPDFYLKQRLQKRKRLIIKALPEAIDLLTLCVTGGLDFMLGLEWVVKRSLQNPLIREFTWVIREVNMGKSRQETLLNMAKRIGMPEVFSFVNTLVHADRMGSPISEVLNILSEEARRRRFQRGERLALQAPIKMLFPLVIFILPAVGIIVGAPILLEFMKGNLLKF